jgi:hypothetical protein
MLEEPPSFLGGVPHPEKIVDMAADENFVVIASHLYAFEQNFQALCIFTHIHAHPLILLML